MPKTQRALLFAGLALAAILSIAHAQAERQLVDGIAAVVGDEIVLESEVDEELYIYKMRTGADIDTDQAQEIRSSIVHQMVDEMLLVAKARRDTILITEEELESEIERRVSELRERHGSEEALHAALTEEGITLDELKRIYRDDIERRLLAEKVVREQVHSNIDVTWGEVREYYESNRDEVALVPEAYRLAGILLAPTPSESARSQAISTLEEAQEKLEQGVPFDEVAREYSDDASAARGGELGWVRRGMMVPEFEEAAFALEPGEISGIVTSRFGFHLIQVLEASEDEVRVRHILTRVALGPEDVERARALAESVRQLAVGGADFASLAEEYSDDQSTSETGGILGWFNTGDMAPSIEAAVSGVEPGGLAPVVEGETGYYVIKVLEHEEERVASLDEVREDLRDYIYGLKAEEAYAELIAELSSEIFVDIRMPTVTPEDAPPSVTPEAPGEGAQEGSP